MDEVYTKSANIKSDRGFQTDYFRISITGNVFGL